MTCSQYEPDLALYVEGDLPGPLVPGIETHLRDCATCRELLAGLRASQAAVGVLRGEPLNEEALALVRGHVLSARTPVDSVPVFRWRWAVAACLASVGTAALWLAMPSVRAPHVPADAVHTAASLPVPPPLATAPPRATPSRLEPLPRPQSTIQRREPVSQGVSRPSATPSLSPDDADQLARAVMAISRITNVQDALREPLPPDPSPTPVVRLATANPDVVIYWRLDSNGGE